MTATYLPGDAHALVTSDLAILVRDLDPTVLASLWETAHTTKPDVTRVLEVLGPAGISAMPEFAAVLRTSQDVRVITRGSGVVEVTLGTGSRAFDASGVSTWSEQRVSAEDLHGVRLALGRTTTGDRLPLVAGVVRAIDVVIDFGSGPAPVRDESTPVAADPPATAPDPEPTPEPDPAPDPTPDPDPTPEPHAAVPSTPDPAETMVEPDDANFDALFGATVAGRRPEDAAVRESEEAPATPVPPPPEVEAGPGQRAGDHDDHTMSPDQFARLRAGARPVAPPPDQGARPHATLTLSTGRVVVVDRPVLMGRSPQARNTSSAELPLLVVLDDPYVSGTHVEIGFAGAELQVTDVSTNGTLMRLTADAPPTKLTKNQRTALPHGAVLQVSDAISIQVSVP